MLDFIHELFLASFLKDDYFNRVSLINDVRAVISIFENQLEFVKIAAGFQLGVGLFSQESLS
jgi:hypothetical protein